MIKLYKDITLNSSNSYFTIFNDLQKYKNSLEAYLSNSIEDDKFALNDSVLMVSAEVFANKDPYKITYCAHEFNGNTLFYHINSVIFQSGFYAFSVADDIWANYFYKANIKDFFAVRTSAHIGEKQGFLDPIIATNEKEIEILNSNRIPSSLSLNDLSILYYVNYETGKSTIFQNGATSCVNGFYNSITELCTEFDAAIPPYYDYDVGIRTAVSRITSIYETSESDLSTKYAAGVIKAYVVPSSILIPSEADITFYCGFMPEFEKYLPQTNADKLKAHFLYNYDMDVSFSFNYDPNYKYFAGVENSGIEISRYAGNHTVTFKFIMNNDGLQVLVYDGEKSYDITDAFEIGISLNDGNITATEKISRTLRTITGVGSGIAQLKLGNYGGGISSLADAANTMIIQSNSKYIGGGDGYITFKDVNSKYPANSPFCVVKYKSVMNENKRAIENGLLYNASMDLFAPMNGVATGFYPRGIFIQGSITIDELPLFALEYITKVFTNGNFFKQVL